MTSLEGWSSTIELRPRGDCGGSAVSADSHAYRTGLLLPDALPDVSARAARGLPSAADALVARIMTCRGGEPGHLPLLIGWQTV